MISRLYVQSDNYMERREFIVGIDLGTSKIAAVAGVKDTLGFITVLAVEQEPSGGCIRRGCVYNVEEAAGKIKRVINKLENKLSPNKIAKVYVGVGGQSLRSVDHRVSVDFDGENVITQSIVQSLEQEARQYQPEMLELLDVVYPRYEINGKPERTPIGVMASEIAVDYKLIVARPSLKRNIARAVTEKAGYRIAGYFVSPLALADFTLTENEKDLGCALIDFGAGTTTLSIYKGGVLRHLIAIPFGGQLLTKDITRLNIVEAEAEQMKIRSGRMGGLVDQPDQLVGGAGQDLKLSELSAVIDARVNELIENIVSQIDKSGFYRSINAGIVLAGEASSLRGLAAVLVQKAGCNVRVADSRNISAGNNGEVHSMAYLQALSIMTLGKENCGDEAKAVQSPISGRPVAQPVSSSTSKKRKERPEKKGPGLFGKFKEGIGNITNNLSNNLFDNVEEEEE